jgi:hypothetical protein
MSWKHLILCCSLAALSACGIRPPRGEFDRGAAPTPPNYSLLKNWAAHPLISDMADRTPQGLTNEQAWSEADVFFLHPTTYTGRRGDRDWNSSVYDRALNRRTDEGPILYQASLFNSAGKVYAPRYRQAHLHAYFAKKRQASARQAFELAYSDVLAAFDYYLRHFNEGRPIIIAAHSQGATHGMHLLKERFDGLPLQRQLVAAYLAGMPVAMDYFQFIKPCGGPEDIGCFCSWRTWRKGRLPKNHIPGNDIVATNPLLWTTAPVYASRSLNKGAVLRNFDKVIPEVADAQSHDGVLWTSRPRFPGSFLLLRANYHIGDYNLYYINVRENAQRRVKAFNGELSKN